jgi:periplasmic divalent cation tolerance protein
MDLVQITTTTDSKASADAIAEHLVQRRLAACGQVLGPVTSTYRWDGKVERAEEFTCLVKTRAELIVLVEEAIRSLHPYEVPEIVAVPIVGGSADYLDWVAAETAGHAPD